MTPDQIKAELDKYVLADLQGNLAVRHLHPLASDLLRMVETKQADIDRQARVILDLMVALRQVRDVAYETLQAV